MGPSDGSKAELHANRATLLLSPTLASRLVPAAATAAGAIESGLLVLTTSKLVQELPSPRCGQGRVTLSTRRQLTLWTVLMLSMACMLLGTTAVQAAHGGSTSSTGGTWGRRQLQDRAVAEFSNVWNWTGLASSWVWGNTKRKGQYSALCVVAKDENQYIEEWVHYHQCLGINKIYLYDHDSTIPLDKQIRPYVDSGFVEYTKFSGEIPILQSWGSVFLLLLLLGLVQGLVLASGFVQGLV
eukprot:gene17854-24243_t